MSEPKRSCASASAARFVAALAEQVAFGGGLDPEILSDAILLRMADPLRDRISEAVRDRIGEAVRERLGDALRTAVRESVGGMAQQQLVH